MKRLIALLLVVLPVLADDVEETLKQARELERRAGVLLDAGNRAQAFELLAQAALLRDKARAAKKAPQKAKPDRGDKAKQPPAPQAANRALRAMDAALMNNDLKKTRAHAEEARTALRRWARELAAREKRLRSRSAPDKPLLKRVESLEKQLEELRRMIRNSR